MKKIWFYIIGAVIVLAIIGNLLPDSSEDNNTKLSENQEIDKTSFNEFALQALYDNGFCY